jgi:hypothetical protein
VAQAVAHSGNGRNASFDRKHVPFAFRRRNARARWIWWRMSCRVEFIQRETVIFAFPFERSSRDRKSFQGLAQDIMRGYFEDGCNLPQSIPPSNVLPDAVRIVDDEKREVAFWSLDDELADQRATEDR